MTQAQKVLLSQLVRAEQDTQALAGNLTYIVDVILSTPAQQHTEAVRIVTNYVAARQTYLNALPAQSAVATATATTAVTDATNLLNSIP